MVKTDSLISVQGVSKTFAIGGQLLGTKLTAVNSAEFELNAKKPEIFAIAGESGSGKSTLARIILRLISQSKGKILFKNRDIADLKSRKDALWFMKEVQPVFQNPFECFNPLRRVEEYLYETAVNFKMCTRANSRELIRDSLSAVGLTFDDVAGRYPGQFSGGQLQRVSVARSLICKPSLLVADEPVSMIDASLKLSIVNLFKDLKERYGMSIIYITHDLATAYYISDRIAIMMRGDIVEKGPVRDVMLNPYHPYTQLLIESIPQVNPQKKWNSKIKLSVIEVKEYLKLGCKFADRCPLRAEYCEGNEPESAAVNGRTVKCHRYSSPIYWREKGKEEGLSDLLNSL